MQNKIKTGILVGVGCAIIYATLGCLIILSNPIWNEFVWKGFLTLFPLLIILGAIFMIYQNKRRFGIGLILSSIIIPVVFFAMMFIGF
ncbi:MAG: hypothetical protein V4469_02260 [Patescibacteria group bacterium]